MLLERGWTLDQCLDLPWSTMGWVAGRVQDRQLELLDLELRPLLAAQGVRKWQGYRPARSTAKPAGSGGGLGAFLAAHKIRVRPGVEAFPPNGPEAPPAGATAGDPPPDAPTPGPGNDAP